MESSTNSALAALKTSLSISSSSSPPHANLGTQGSVVHRLRPSLRLQARRPGHPALRPLHPLPRRPSSPRCLARGAKVAVPPSSRRSHRRRRLRSQSPSRLSRARSRSSRQLVQLAALVEPIVRAPLPLRRDLQHPRLRLRAEAARRQPGPRRRIHLRPHHPPRSRRRAAPPRRPRHPHREALRRHPRAGRPHPRPRRASQRIVADRPPRALQPRRHRRPRRSHPPHVLRVPPPQRLHPALARRRRRPRPHDSRSRHRLSASPNHPFARSAPSACPILSRRPTSPTSASSSNPAASPTSPPAASPPNRSASSASSSPTSTSRSTSPARNSSPSASTHPSSRNCRRRCSSAQRRRRLASIARPLPRQSRSPAANPFALSSKTSSPPFASDAAARTRRSRARCPRSCSRHQRTDRQPRPPRRPPLMPCPAKASLHLLHGRPRPGSSVRTGRPPTVHSASASSR